MAVSRQELFDAKSLRAMVGPEQHDVSEAVRDQFYSANDEGAHDELAELAVGLHELQQVFAVDFDDLARLADAHSEHRWTAGEHIDLPGELTWAVNYDECLDGAGWADNLHPTRLNHKERYNLLPWLDEHLAGLD